MPIDVILPALGMAQETGKIVQWLKAEGEQVKKGQPIAEIETDKAIVELEAPSDGVLTGINGAVGDDVPVGQVIARILMLNELSQEHNNETLPATQINNVQNEPIRSDMQKSASRLASRIANEHRIDLNLITPTGKRIQKADVLTYLQNQHTSASTSTRLTIASPKARRLAIEQGKDLTTIKGTGPDGAVLAADVLATTALSLSAISLETPPLNSVQTVEKAPANTNGTHEMMLSTTWRIMAERTTQSWTSVPHFFLTHEVRANRLIAWRAHILKRSSEKVTYTDLLVKIVATALRRHPWLNATWHNGTIILQDDVNIGLAAAIEDGLVVPVIHQADMLNINDIAKQRKDLVNRAQTGKLHLQDLQGGTFTISNLGMYKVDSFHAIINTPQVAILAVGQMADRVIPVDGQPSIQPMLTLTLSCDHRVVDGAQGAKFLTMIAELIEEPLGLVD